MKAPARILALAILSIHVCSSSTAQKASFTTNRGMTIGFGVGAAYQKSDLVNSRGGGFDFVLGSQLYKKENAFFSVDWKFRFLAGENRAYDHRINPDITYGNTHYRFFSYDLELGLTLNRLRERTRIVVTGFAGAGITHGMTATDLYDAAGNLYDYSGIDPNRDSKQVYDDLVALSDGNFETKLINRAAILPTAGFFVGYQFTRSFSMGIEFKTSFYLTEHNSSVGIDLDNRIIEGSAIDRNNYVGLGFKWQLRGGGSSSGYSAGDNRTLTQPVPITTESTFTAPSVYMPTPTVHIFDPSAESYQTVSSTHTIKATVRDVSGPDSISFYQNGQPNNDFTYNATMKTFSADVRLRDGENTFRIAASNQTSTAEDLVSITLEKSSAAVTIAAAEAVTSPPEISIISHVNKSVRTYETSAGMRAMVLNVNSKEDITLNINGVSTRDFNFNSSTKVLTTNIDIRDGNNVVKISAKNESGSDAEDRVFIKEARPCPLPLINLINPAREQINTNQQTHEVWAEVRNIANSNQVVLAVNGKPVTFNFSNNLISSSVPLINGTNILSVNARNECGEANSSARITYSPSLAIAAPCMPPKVSFTVNETNRDDASHELRGSISNIEDKADISLLLDGSLNDGFRFNPATGEMNSEFKLTPGSHTVVVSVRNACGTDNMGVNINMKQPCIPPKVSFTVSEINRDEASHELRGSVSNLENRSGISLRVDGKAENRFLFDPASGNLNAEFKLTPGSHTFRVSVVNACGSDNQDVSVIKKEPCIPPKVSFTVSEVGRDEASHELRGSVSNVKNRSDISFIIDRNASDGFRFDPASGDLIAGFNLPPGSHSIIVSVTNACGSDNQGVTVIIEEPCIPPKVSFTISEVNRTDASHELRGSVSNVNKRAGISLTLDGNPDNGFRFDPATGDLSAEYLLSPGPHTIVISATNTCGSDNQGVNINIEEPCIPPKVSFTLSEVIRDDASHELKGSVSNVKDRSGISLTVNGNADDRFQFAPQTGDLKAWFKLAPGSHTIVVSVTNACGTDNQSVSVNIEEPCIPPKVSITVSEVNRDDASHELSGSISNVEDRAGISLRVNGNTDNSYQYNPATGVLNARFTLTPGSHTIVVSVTNDCGSDNQDVSVLIEEPCIPPKVSFTVSEEDRDDAGHELSGSVSNVKDRTDISLTVNGNPDDGFRFDPATGDLNATVILTPGTHTIAVSVNNECGADRQEVSVIVEEPCIPPRVSFTIAEVNRDDASHELSGSVSNVANKADISLTLDGIAEDGFEFVSATGDLNAKFKLSSGNHMIVVSVASTCGNDNQGVNVIIEEVEEEEEEEEPCGVRINPGNSSWQFCLVTTSGTFSRDDLTDENFSYSGQATSLYFLPIGGGGDVMVNGSSYSVRSGQYYLFTGNLNVTVSTRNPGSMGHWSVCVSADSEPVYGNGNNRPESPCDEKEGNDVKKAKGNKR